MSDFYSLMLAAFQREALKKIVFSRPVSKQSAQKVTGRLCAHRGRRILALEYTLKDNTVSQRNVKEDELDNVIPPMMDEYGQVDLITVLGNAEFKRSAKGRELTLGADKLKRRLDGDAPNFESAIEALENKKEYIFKGDESFLTALGISDKSGRVHDKKQGKFRQICRFVEQLEDVYSYLPSEGALSVYDLCCGKSYLGFAVYHYLTSVKGRTVRMLGVDLKGETVKKCESVAKEIHFDGMRFVSADIRQLPRDEAPHLVLSLHACDIATDIVLDSAVRLGADVILSTPCCHKYLSGKINSPALGFVTEYPHLKNKLCEVITDALRLARLKAVGYKVSALEFTDPDSTPKNTLLRAIKLKSPSKERLAAAEDEYKRILDFVLGDRSENYLSEIY